MTPADRRKLAAILGMLGSEHAGERASAALQAEAFRKRHGLTWEEMLAVPTVDVVEEAPEPVWTPPPAPPPEPESRRDPAQQSEQAKWDARPAWYRQVYPGWAPVSRPRRFRL